MKKNQSISKSQIPHRIVRALLEHKKIRFTELRKELKISKPVLSHHLQVLIKENAIVATQKGRERYYELNENHTKTLEEKFHHLFSSYTIYHDLVERDTDLDAGELLRWLSSVIGSIYLFFMLKSIENGIDLTKNINLNDFKYFELEHLLTYIVDSEDPLEEIDFEALKDDNELFAMVKKIISKKIYHGNLQTLIGQLKSEFSDPMSILNEKLTKLGLDKT